MTFPYNQMHIQILPGNLANMIAAGEVVQRPASVVKELMENAVDAGAGTITLAVQDAGRTLIQLIDDGCGMSPDDAMVCFERHATSKLSSPEDLSNILTYGFRGEALASIAAVAQVCLRTRREEDETGFEVNISGSEIASCAEVASPKGCNISVRDLFYNVPARRKFLKSDNIEFKHIVAEFTRVALTRPEIGFNLTHNGREVFSLKKNQSLKLRIQGLLGRNMSENLMELSTETVCARISGFVGKPESARKGSSDQYFFVNGRYFRSPYLHKAVLKAYEDFVPEGMNPQYFLFLEMDPHSIDVNISPTKTEIKFEDDSIVFQTVYAAVKEVLGKEVISRLDFESGDMPEIPVLSGNFEQFRPISEPKISIDPSYNPFESDGFPTSDLNAGGFVGGKPAGFDSVAYGEKSGFCGRLFEEHVTPSFKSFSLADKYIITGVRSGLVIINIHRAKERILFDRFLDALNGHVAVSQQALFPEPVEIGVENKLLLDENSALLSSLGFDIRAFGDDTVVVNGVPDGFSAQQGKVLALMDSVLAVLKENSGGLKETLNVAMAEKFARLGASSSEIISSPTQAQRLIDTLFACNNAEYTNSGKKIMTLISLDELEKRF